MPSSRGSFEADPRRGDDDGVFGCRSLLASGDVRPKELPLQTQIAFISSKIAADGRRC
jgi:fumarate reductase iron-sulfur subunit